MTADTRPVAQEAARDRLRKVVKPGWTVWAANARSRSGDTCRVHLKAVAVDRDNTNLIDLNDDVQVVLGLRWAPGDGVPGRRALLLSGDYSLTRLLDRLSVALFGEPGQIKGEYL